MAAISNDLMARSIGERIKKARKEAGLSQADLAQRIGVSQPAIVNWEMGVHDPRRVSLAKLAEALNAPLDWLAAGDRSAAEHDKHAAAAYLRRPLQHVPVISLRSAALFAHDMTADPNSMAEDYIPFSARSSRVFAIFVNDEAVNRTFGPESLVVIDYSDRAPKDGAFCLALSAGAPVVRRWRENPRRLEPDSLMSSYQSALFDASITIIGCAQISVRFH